MTACESVTPPQGGKPGWAALTSPRIGPWLRLLKKMAEAYSLVPELGFISCFFLCFFLWRMKCEGDCFFLCVGV